MVQIYSDDKMGSSQNLICGLPQGSLLLPILFMLYNSSLLKLGNPLKKFCYAYDVAILATKNSLSENVEELAELLAEATKWGQIEGVISDSNKSKLQHFPLHCRDKDPLSTPFVTFQSILASKKTRRPDIIWLGVYFDKALCSKWHVRILKAKAMKIANAQRSLMIS